MIGDIVDSVKGNSGGILGKAYDDLVHPTAKATGIMMSYPTRTLRVLFAPYEKWLINKEESIKVVSEAVHKKLDKVPENKRCTPEAYVAIPTIQQLCISQDSKDLREMYANLLVSSMNKDTKDSVLPGYVNIIGQLSPDEAKLLKFLFKKSTIPALEVRVCVDKENQDEFISSMDCFVEIPDEVIEISDNINSYIENLQRLQLIRVAKDRHIVNRNEEYNRLQRAFEEEARDTESLKDKYFTFEKEILEITLLGRSFIKICSDEEEL